MKDPIIQIGAPILRAQAAPITKKDLGSKKLRAVIARMKKALIKEEFGVAIAAPQVGGSLRLFVVAGRAFMKPELEEKKSGASFASVKRGSPRTFSKQAPAQPDMVFINPEIIRLSKKKKGMSEGCLSVRGKYGTVLRHEKASIKAYDESGKSFIYHGSGLIAHIFQHECDHLDGILYVDKAVRLVEDKDPQTARAKLKKNRGV